MANNNGSGSASWYNEATQKAIEVIEHLTENIGPRPVGSAQEAQAAAYVQQELERAGFNNIQKQEFTAPKSAWQPFAIAGAVALIGVSLWMLSNGSIFGAYLGAVFCGFALWEIYAKLNFGWTPLSALTAKTKSQNVAVSIAPTEDEGRNLIITAHLDTQRTPIFSVSKRSLVIWYAAFYTGLIILLLTLTVYIISWFAEWPLPYWVGLPSAIVCLVVIAVMVHTDFTPFTDGANDNAGSVGVALALAEYFQQHPLQHTRLWFVFTGSEESGCYGAGAFFEKMENDLLQAYVVALEGVAVHKPAYATQEGMLRRYRSNSELLRLMDKIAKDKPQLSLRAVKLPAGYTEAGLASKRGYRAMTLIGMDANGMMPYWHSREDTADKVNPEAVAAALTALDELSMRLDGLPVSVKLAQVKPLAQRG